MLSPFTVCAFLDVAPRSDNIFPHNSNASPPPKQIANQSVVGLGVCGYCSFSTQVTENWGNLHSHIWPSSGARKNTTLGILCKFLYRSLINKHFPLLTPRYPARLRFNTSCFKGACACCGSSHHRPLGRLQHCVQVTLAKRGGALAQGDHERGTCQRWRTLLEVLKPDLLALIYI